MSDNNYGLSFRVVGGKLNGAGAGPGSGSGSGSGTGASNYPGKGSSANGAASAKADSSSSAATPVDLEEEGCEQPPEKEEPQIKITSVEIVAPSNGFLLKRPFKVTGCIEWIKERSGAKSTVMVEAIGCYKGEEDSYKADGMQANIEDDNSFTVEFAALYEPKAWTDDAERAPEATWELFARASASIATAKKESAKVTFPQEEQLEPDIKLGHYDDKGNGLNPKKYPTEGANYLAGTPVFDWQGYLVDFNYLPKGDKIGIYGPKSEAAVKAFQKDALTTKRCIGTNGKIIDASSVSFTGSQNGVIDAHTRAELQKWKLEKWKRPMVPIRHGEGDDEGVNNRKVERGSDDHHAGRVVLEKQEQLKAVAAYSGKSDGWFWDTMKTSVVLFQDHAARGEFLIEGILKEIEDKLTGYTKGVLDIPTQDMLERVKEMGGKVVIKEEDFAIDWKFICKQEGTRNSMYVPTAKDGTVLGNSGPTIASGFDLGQINIDGLKAYAFSSSIESKLACYVLKKGAEAKSFVTKNPLKLNDTEIAEINKKVKNKYALKAEAFYNEVAGDDDTFKQQPADVQTSFASVYFQYGTAKTLRGNLVAKNYLEGVKTFLGFTSKVFSVENDKTHKKTDLMQYIERRCQEARLLSNAISDTKLKQTASELINSKEADWEAAHGKKIFW